MPRFTRAALAAALLSAAAAPALAHTSYLLPTTFDATDVDYVTLQSSFTEKFFTPEIAVDSTEWHVVRPDGSRADFAAVTPFRQMIVLESSIDAEGTWRFTTGERLGRESHELLLPDGTWQVIEEGVARPEGAQEMVVQTATVADVYVSKGALTREAVDAPIGRLIIHPVTHPNDIYSGEPFEFDLIFDGAGLANHDLLIYREGGEYEEPHYEQPLVTDAAGHASATFDKPGVYLVMTRHRAESPEGATTDIRSYTTSLTFEVLPQ